MHKVKTQRSGEWFVKNMHILNFCMAVIKKYKVKKFFSKFPERLEYIAGNFPREISKHFRTHNLKPDCRWLWGRAWNKVLRECRPTIHLSVLFVFNACYCRGNFAQFLYLDTDTGAVLGRQNTSPNNLPLNMAASDFFQWNSTLLSCSYSRVKYSSEEFWYY